MRDPEENHLPQAFVGALLAAILLLAVLLANTAYAVPIIGAARASPGQEAPCCAS
jgi:hypothetical protein